MVDSAEVSALLELVNYGYLFVGLFLGFSIPKFFKLLDLSIKFLSKKLVKDKTKKEKNSNNSEVMK
ncbi:hypothetical protein [uncultured Eubacterium sp.]|uniref:hypothetical protein n=1 Tax=uncultured Eubacterium sp. TaxID=165185 RepID=UPI0025F5130E|nr:hypothetical protein [uncultured Eubacterium sp.]